MDVKINTVDMKEVRRLEQRIDGKMYSVSGNNARGLEISVVIPFGTNRGVWLFLKALRQFARSAWRVTA